MWNCAWRCLLSPWLKEKKKDSETIVVQHEPGWFSWKIWGCYAHCSGRTSGRTEREVGDTWSELVWDNSLGESVLWAWRHSTDCWAGWSAWTCLREGGVKSRDTCDSVHRSAVYLDFKLKRELVGKYSGLKIYNVRWTRVLVLTYLQRWCRKRARVPSLPSTRVSLPRNRNCPPHWTCPRSSWPAVFPLGGYVVRMVRVGYEMELRNVRRH